MTTPVVVRKKYEMCKNWREKGNCRYGDKCLFAHGDNELSRKKSGESEIIEMPQTTSVQ